MPNRQYSGSKWVKERGHTARANFQLAASWVIAYAHGNRDSGKHEVTCLRADQRMRIASSIQGRIHICDCSKGEKWQIVLLEKESFSAKSVSWKPLECSRDPGWWVQFGAHALQTGTRVRTDKQNTVTLLRMRAECELHCTLLCRDCN